MDTIKGIKQILVNGIVAGIILSLIYFMALFSGIYLFPQLVEEYYNPVFNMQGNKALLYFMHPFIVSFVLAWFWHRFKSFFKGSFWLRGLELGLMYGGGAVLPYMWIIFCSFAVSFSLVISWFFYGLLQGIVVGIFYARISP